MKICSKCNIEKNLKDFNKKSSTKDGLQYICKVCDRVRAKSLYSNNRNYYKEHAALNKQANQLILKNYIVDYLKNNPCIDCGEADLRCLEFDHVKDVKFKNISQIVVDNNSLDKLKVEIEKCEVRCANCHRKRTSDSQNWFKGNFLIET